MSQKGTRGSELWQGAVRARLLGTRFLVWSKRMSFSYIERKRNVTCGSRLWSSISFLVLCFSGALNVLDTTNSSLTLFFGLSVT